MERVLRGAEVVFRERGYEAASVSAICRRVGLAQGTFYLYFANKEEVYVCLVEDLQAKLIARVRAAINADSELIMQLLAMYYALLDYIAENAGLFQVFREAEFVRPEIPMRFYAAVCGELAAAVRAGVAVGVFREIDADVVAYSVLGAALFLALRYVIWGGGVVPPEARDAGAGVIRGGISEQRGISVGLADLQAVASNELRADVSDAPSVLEGGEATRQALLRAAERAFGQAGFHGTTISAITYLAGVGQGTFYLYFPSKVAIFTELVREISRGFRRRQTLAVAQCADRTAAEVEGLRSFWRWVREHPGAYRILREAEFVDEGVGKWYYTRLAEGYSRGLAAAMRGGEIRTCDPEALAYTLLGVAHLSGQRWALWEEVERRAESVLPQLVALVVGGLEKVPGGRRSGGRIAVP